jgi:hypothetical protein
LFLYIFSSRYPIKKVITGAESGEHGGQDFSHSKLPQKRREMLSKVTQNCIRCMQSSPFLSEERSFELNTHALGKQQEVVKELPIIFTCHCIRERNIGPTVSVVETAHYTLHFCRYNGASIKIFGIYDVHFGTFCLLKSS